MKQKILSPLVILFITIIAVTGLTSCTDDDYYGDNLITAYNWELVAVNNIPVREMDVCEFQFYPSGDGTYGQYNNAGQWYQTMIRWDVDYAPGGAEYLYVYPNGSYETWRYLMRLYGGRPAVLELTDLDTGQLLTFESY